MRSELKRIFVVKWSTPELLHTCIHVATCHWTKGKCHLINQDIELMAIKVDFSYT